MRGRSALTRARALGIVLCVVCGVAACRRNAHSDDAARPSPSRSEPQETPSSAEPPKQRDAHSETRGVDLAYRREPDSSKRKRQPPPPSGTVELEVPEHRPAVVSLPAKRGRHRVFVVAHGAGGKAEHHCSFWRQLLGSDGIIACPRGTALYERAPQRGFFYRNHHHLEAEVMALEKAVREEYAGRIHPEGWVYAGYSQGATMGALMIVEHGDVFSHLALVEGGTDGWTRTRAQKFSEGGGRKVLFVCGQSGCAQKADRAAAALRNADVQAQARHAQGGGHTYLGQVGKELASGLKWLLAKE